jgi:hypothetical protein
MSDVPPEAAPLFRVEPGRFVAERDGLVKELRAAGHDELAAQVKALRKPTAATWALNQLSVRDAEGVEALFETGRQLRAAQQAALSGGRGDDLVTASAARREAVASLTRVALSAMEEAGQRGAPQADAIASALEAASIDNAIGARLASGTLETVPTAGGDLGFGEAPVFAAVPGGRTEAAGRSRADTARLRRERDAARKTAENKRAAADRLASQLADLESRLEQLNAEHAAAESAALEAETQAERAARRLDDES